MTKKNIRILLLVWDAVAAVLIFFSLIMMFETVIKNLLLDANAHVFTEIIDDAQVQYRNALGFLKEKPALPYADGVKAIAAYLKDLALSGLKHEHGAALVLSRDPALPNTVGLKGGADQALAPADVDYRSFYFAAARLPVSLDAAWYARLEKTLAQNDLEFLRHFYPAAAGQPATLAGFPDRTEAARLRAVLAEPEEKYPNHVQFSLQGRDYVGAAEFLDPPLGRGLARNAPETWSPILVAAEDKGDFFFLVNNIRNLFLAVLGGILAVVFAVKLYNTIVITREIKAITLTIRDESRAIEKKGEIGTALKEMALNFGETASLYDSYSQLSVKLADVGEIISGIADRDLFIATLKNDKSLLDPHEVNMAILFLDVQGFTSVSEKHKEKAMSLINRIWSTVEEATGQRAGKINKYMGDAALVIFPDGDPDKAEPAARRALRAGIEILEKVPALKRELGIEFNFRIGIDYGKLVYGKTGSDRNYELGVIGDPVNTASRCEALNKKYGTNLILTGEALKASGLKASQPAALSEDKAKEHRLFLVDKARPAGKKEARELYTVLVAAQGAFRLAGADALYPSAALDSYRSALAELIDGISAWQGGDKKAGAKKWGAIARQVGALYAECQLPPARIFLTKLLAHDEYAAFQSDPAAWTGRGDLKIKAPDADWIAYGAVELPK